MRAPLTIFVPHCSDMLTDHLPHGDGLTAYGFITNLAKRGHRLHVAVQRVDLRGPLPANVTLYQIPLKSENKVILRLEYMVRVRSLLNRLGKEIQFDLVHQLNPVFAGMSLALVGCGLPMVLGTYVPRWSHDPDGITAAGGLRGRLAAYGRDLVSGLQQLHADALLLTSPAAQNRLPDPPRVSDRIYYLTHGVDTAFFSPAEKKPSGDSGTTKSTILFFANVLKRKGIFTLLEAFVSVAQGFPNVTLQIAGDGPELPEAKRIAATLACADKIEFLGGQDRQSAPALFRNCTLYCLPSYGEPYAGTVLEAISCGKPVVVTDAGGLPYLVPEGGGLLVPPADAPALSVALLALLNNPALCQEMGRINRQFAEANMAWDRVAGKLEGIYEATLCRLRQRRTGEPAASNKFAVTTKKAVQERT